MSAILDRVRKLRALATSDNVNEAAAAAAAAERLIQAHNLSEAEINATADEPVGVDWTPIAAWVKVPTWQAQLLAILSRAYSCKGIFSYRRVQDTRSGRMRAEQIYLSCGRPSDVETLRYQFAYFTSEIERLTGRHARGKGRTWANSFRHGAVRAIWESLRAVQAETRAQATSAALVAVDARAARAALALDQAFPSQKSRAASAVRLNGSAYEQGKEAGAGINQRSQIAASGARMLSA